MQKKRFKNKRESANFNLMDGGFISCRYKGREGLIASMVKEIFLWIH
jgi:hypothetical protein